MPALRIFGRRWHIASDDIPVPALVLAAFHLVWVALLIVWLAYIHGPRHCEQAWKYDVAVGGLLGAFAVSFVLEVWAVREGLQGSIFETKRRWRIPSLIYANICSFLAQVAFNGYGTYLIYNDPPHCEPGEEEPWNPVNAMKGLVWSTWAIIALLLTMVVISYNIFPDFEDPKSWEQHCRCVGWACCCCDKADTFRGEGQEGEQTLMSRLGRLFAVMFGHVDMVPSDIVVAFVLAMTLQRIQRTAAEQAQQEDAGDNGDVGTATLGGKPQRAQQAQRRPRGWPWPLHGQKSRKRVRQTQHDERKGEGQRSEPVPDGALAARKGLLQLTDTTVGGALEPGAGARPSAREGESGRVAPRRMLSRSGSPQCTDPLMSSYLSTGNGVSGFSKESGSLRKYENGGRGQQVGGTLTDVTVNVLEDLPDSSLNPLPDAGAQDQRAGAELGASFSLTRSPHAAVDLERGSVGSSSGEAVEILPPLAASQGAPTSRAPASASARRRAGWPQDDAAQYYEDVAQTSSFMPARPVGDILAMGAAKTSSEDEAHKPTRGSSHRGERGEVEDAVVEQAAYYCKYAFAAYGWMLSIYRRPGVGWVQLCCGRSCGFLLGMCLPSHRPAAPKKQQLGRGQQLQQRQQLPVHLPVPVPDLRLGANLNREAIQQAAGLSNADLCFTRYEGESPNVLPYYIGVDTNSQEVILAIRGSLSLEDVMRDLLFEPAELDEWVHNTRDWHELPPEIRLAGPGCRAAAHSGILEAARATLMDIQQAEVLHSLLLAPGARCANYRLVLVGHSLGAGCAFLLGLYMQPYFPNLKCWAFSPPGGLTNSEIGASGREWCTSVVCGKEWIPRLSVDTFNRMRDEIIYAAARCRLPKLRVVMGMMRGKRWEEEKLFYAPEDIPQEAADTLHAYHESVQRPSRLRDFMEVAGNGGVPGRVIHLKPVGEQISGRWRKHKRRMYRAVWIEPSAITEEGILISGRMMADHMPDYLLATLQRMVRARKRNSSTATVGDSAGQDMVDHMMTNNQGEEGRRGEEAGVFSESDQD